MGPTVGGVEAVELVTSWPAGRALIGAQNGLCRTTTGLLTRAPA